LAGWSYPGDSAVAVAKNLPAADRLESVMSPAEVMASARRRTPALFVGNPVVDIGALSPDRTTRESARSISGDEVVAKQLWRAVDRLAEVE
jgi:hypothetical protein